MFVFPAKWLPWIMLIGGIFVFFTEGNAFSLLCAVIGGVWLYLSHKKD